ncbi:MAG: SDR family oxidoreductase [Eggerthellaceae bacterium]|nr:SDR family oxidoreductase [Eggerthellaceae bacterium]
MNVIISGTSSGIGLAIARKFLADGFEVFGFDALESVIEHGHYHHVIHDIRDEFSGRPVAQDGQAVPDPDYLINNAGTQDDELAIDVNLEGTIRFSRAFTESPVLKSVLFIASASARNGAEFPRYVASKAGVVGYMKNLALQLAPRGITVNSISPGGVVTPINDHILKSDELYSAVKAETLLGKWAQPEEVADLAYFLTVTNRSITGEDILIDNGEMLKSNFIW